MNRSLQALFDPSSVAIVGASNDTRKYGNWLSVQALRGEQRRAVYLVNHKGQAVLGRPTVAALGDIGGGVELVAIATPASTFEQTVSDALAMGAQAIVAVTAGFAELGSEGRAVQDRVAQRVRDAGAVLLGPNCLGVADTTSELSLAITPLPPGSVSLLSQSGNMAIELGEFLTERHLGIARFASLGNQADLCAADVIRDCAVHEGTKLIALYCEDFRDGRDFVAAATEARRLGKPVVLLTVGSSLASIRGAKSHTGALTSDTAVIDAACRAAGIYRVSSLREMADVASVLLNFGMRPVRSVAILADGGGHAGVGSDIAEAAGLYVREFSEKTQQSLKAELPPSAGILNPIDIAGAGDHDVTVFGRVLDVALADPGIDSVLITGGYGVYADYGEAMARAEAGTAVHMAQSAEAARKPLLVHTMWPGKKSVHILTEHGVPVFRAVEDAARTLGVVAKAREPRLLAPLVNRSEVPVDDGSYWAARKLFAAAGLKFPHAELVHSRTEAETAAKRFGYPVVLKAMGLLHKSDAGGVALELADADELGQAFKDMDKRLGAPAYTVEAMADLRNAVELIAGVQADPRFGPVVMVGLGGVLTEVLRDVAFALAPVDVPAARQMLESLRSAAVLRGVRGKPVVNVDAAAEAIACISRVAADHPEISELEVNPLLVTPHGALALDARVVRSAS